MSVSEKMKGNTNAEKWTLEVAENFFIDALELSYNQDYDFIGEIAQHYKQDKGVFDYLITKFPDFKRYKKKILSNCETNCFRNSKKGKINTAIGIVNLKSNHGWTDRVDNTVKADVKVQSIEPIKWVEDAED